MWNSHTCFGLALAVLPFFLKKKKEVLPVTSEYQGFLESVGYGAVWPSRRGVLIIWHMRFVSVCAPSYVASLAQDAVVVVIV